MKYDDELFFGWDEEKELLHTTPPLCAAVSLADLPVSSDIPADFDPDWFMQDMQGPWPFCHSHMRTGMEEWLYYLQYHKPLQFSRRFGAITNMRMDGNDRSPAGASITGSIKAAIQYGNGLEEQLPYFGPDDKYSNVIPSSFKSVMSLKTVMPGIDSYDALDKALTSGRAVVGFGMDWYSGFSNIGTVDTFSGNPFTGSYLGGHAIFFGGWRTINGSRHPLLHNSHPRFGVRCRVAVAPRTCDLILRANRYGVYAATNIESTDPDPQGQDWDWVLRSHF